MYGEHLSGGKNKGGNAGIKIKEAIQREQEKSKTEKRLKLPATVDGENVSYYRQMENRGLIEIGMIVLSAILFYAVR